MKQTRVEEKRQRLLSVLEKGVAQIHLDARRAGVIVPERFRSQHQLVLNLSYRYDPADLTVSEWGVRETLSFGGTGYTVGVPWSAVFGIGSDVAQEFYMYPDDMPHELLAGMVEKIKSMDENQNRPDPDAGPRAVLRRVVTQEPSADTAEKAGQPVVAESLSSSEAEKNVEQAPTSTTRKHLRVVK
jgi:stringent starvation protein B